MGIDPRAIICSLVSEGPDYASSSWHDVSGYHRFLMGSSLEPRVIQPLHVPEAHASRHGLLGCDMQAVECFSVTTGCLATSSPDSPKMLGRLRATWFKRRTRSCDARSPVNTHHSKRWGDCEGQEGALNRNPSNSLSLVAKVDLVFRLLCELRDKASAALALLPSVLVWFDFVGNSCLLSHLYTERRG